MSTHVVVLDLGRRGNFTVGPFRSERAADDVASDLDDKANGVRAFAQHTYTVDEARALIADTLRRGREQSS